MADAGFFRVSLSKVDWSCDINQYMELLEIVYSIKYHTSLGFLFGAHSMGILACHVDIGGVCLPILVNRELHTL